MTAVICARVSCIFSSKFALHINVRSSRAAVRGTIAFTRSSLAPFGVGVSGLKLTQIDSSGRVGKGSQPPTCCRRFHIFFFWRLSPYIVLSSVGSKTGASHLNALCPTTPPFVQQSLRPPFAWRRSHPKVGPTATSIILASLTMHRG